MSQIRQRYMSLNGCFSTLHLRNKCTFSYKFYGINKKALAKKINSQAVEKIDELCFQGHCKVIVFTLAILVDI